MSIKGDKSSLINFSNKIDKNFPILPSIFNETISQVNNHKIWATMLYHLILRNGNNIINNQIIQYPIFKKCYPILNSKIYFTNSQIVCSRSLSYAGFYTALSQSTPVIFLQNTLINFHEVSGLPWWAVIFITTLGIRSAIVLPLTIHQHQVMSRLANINAELGNVAAELNKEVNVARRMFNWNEEQSKMVFRKELKKIHNRYVIRDNCHPFKAVLLILIQVPCWICFSVSLRNLTCSPNAFQPDIGLMDLNLKNEGVLWFPDLTIPDPIFIPLLLIFVNLSLIEIHNLRHSGSKSLLQKIILHSSRILTLIVAAAATVNPSAVTFYWLCSSTFGVGQILLLMVPKVRQVLRIPKLKNESLSPFSDIIHSCKKYFHK